MSEEAVGRQRSGVGRHWGMKEVREGSVEPGGKWQLGCEQWQGQDASIARCMSQAGVTQHPRQWPQWSRKQRSKDKQGRQRGRWSSC